MLDESVTFKLKILFSLVDNTIINNRLSKAKQDAAISCRIA